MWTTEKAINWLCKAVSDRAFDGLSSEVVLFTYLRWSTLDPSARALVTMVYVCGDPNDNDWITDYSHPKLPNHLEYGGPVLTGLTKWDPNRLQTEVYELQLCLEVLVEDNDVVELLPALKLIMAMLEDIVNQDPTPPTRLCPGPEKALSIDYRVLF